MTMSRRQALTFAGAAALAACQRHQLSTPTHGQAMDTHRLDHGFPILAQRAAPGAFALGVMDLQTASTWYWNTERGFPLAAAAAAPIAAAALAQVDAGKLPLAERVSYDASELSPPPSLIGRDWPSPPDKRHGVVPVTDLFALALRDADSTAIDLLMRSIGGPGAVGAFLQFKGVLGLRVDRYQREIAVDMEGMAPFKPAWKDLAAFNAVRDALPAPTRQAAMDAYIRDPRDTTTAPAALGFLAMLAGGDLISPDSTARLLGWMGSASGGLFRAGLPAGVQVAHVTGLSGIDLGFTPSMAELAIVTFPDHRRYAMAGFLVGSTATEAWRAALFADAARLASQAIG
jgi:beta-lactamase class A